MKHSLLVSALLVFMFFTAQIIGLVIVKNYSIVLPTGEVSWKALPSLGVIELERPEINKDISFILFFALILVGTLFLLLIIRFEKVFIWKLAFFFGVLLTLYIAFNAFMPADISFAFALLFSVLKTFRTNIVFHNFTELFIYGGLAAIFVPLLSVTSAFALLVLISIYDAYAVWKSKHMIKMAEFQSKTGLFPGMTVPYERVKVLPSAKKKSAVRKVRAAILGGGDVGFPLFFSGTVLTFYGFFNSFIVSVFASVALAALIMFGKKEKFYPAMPFISLGCFIGFVLSLILQGYLY